VKKILSFQWFRILELDPTSSAAGFTVYVRPIRTIRKSVGLQANVFEAFSGFYVRGNFMFCVFLWGEKKIVSCALVNKVNRDLHAILMEK
jgi:hypothetical protein